MPLRHLHDLTDDVLARATRIRLACFDVDGTLTDGRIFLDSEGREQKAFHVQDGQGLVLLKRAGIEVVTEDRHHPRATGESPASGREVVSGARDARSRFTRRSETDEPGAKEEAEASKAGGRSELWETLIGPPPKLDRRLAESLALSAVSLLAARRVGLALGGGMTLPVYFAIWFALRRMTGLGRRR